MVPRPPLEPMLARLVRVLPEGDGLRYEPKWDGFRCLAFAEGDAVDLQSRNARPFSRYFPEVANAVRALHRDVVLDGELMVCVGGVFDFAALMARLHPAKSRAAQLAAETPATFVVFDLLALDGVDLTARTYDERRAALVSLTSDASEPLALCPATTDVALARTWLEPGAAGIDGVMVKRAQQAYEAGRRTLTKVKLERTVDCVVAGFRWFDDPPGVASLLLGVYDDAGTLVHIGVASSLTRAVRSTMLAELAPLAVPLEGHPWAQGYALEGGPMGRLRGAAGRWTPEMEMDWVPIAPERVCEVAFGQLDGHRFRSPARFVRWRPDRDAASCTLDQLAAATPA